MVYPCIVIHDLVLKHCVIMNFCYLHIQMCCLYFKSIDKFYKWPNLITSGQIGFDHHAREGCNDRVKLPITLKIEELL